MSQVPSLLQSMYPDGPVLVAARRALHRKAVLISMLLATGYVGCVYPTSPTWFRFAAAVVLLHGLLGLATGVMHDANHGAFSASRRVNSILSYSADLLGASSWCWRQQHNAAHHRHTNVEGLDGDIDQAPFARLTESQTWRRYHSFQHVYLWLLYGFMVVKWVSYGDLRSLRAHVKDPSLTVGVKLSTSTLAAAIAGKLVHLGLFVALPMLWHAPVLVLIWYLVISWVFGFSLAVVFQLAHCVPLAEFRTDAHDRTPSALFEHQLATTVDIESRSKLGSRYMFWLFGGLDHQVEHHLAPRLPHTTYRTMRARVDELAIRQGTHRRRHPSLFSAITSHYRLLRALAVRPS